MAVAPVAPVQACKYNVRDTGFVDFDPAPYRLVVFTNRELPAAWVRHLRQVAEAALLDANVELALTNIEAARQFLPTAPATAERPRPAAALVAPDGRVLPRPLPPSPTSEDAWRLIEETVTSPWRDRLSALLVDSFAVIVLAEGPDAAENERVRQAALGAVARFRPRLPRLPKPVHSPPRVLQMVSAGPSAPATPGIESVTATTVDWWSLGMSVTNRAEAEVAVLYGRGRRVGPVLRGVDVTEDAILQVLILLGQDCECDLDRRWLRGPLLPLRWGQALQRQVVRELGFDAENPMVQLEIARIVARGTPWTGRRRTPARDAGPGLGYAEVGLDETPAVASEPAAGTGEAEPPELSARAEATSARSPETADEEAEADAPRGWIRRMVLSLLALTGIVGAGMGLILMFSRRAE